MPPTTSPAPRDSTRVVVEAVRPEIDAGRFPAKGSVGEAVEVAADVFCDGHDIVAGALWVRAPGDVPTVEHPLEPVGNDRMCGAFVPDQAGTWAFTVVGWVDRFATWRHDMLRRPEAEQDVEVDLEIGARLIDEAVARAEPSAAATLSDAAAALRSGRGVLDVLHDDEVRVALRRWSERGSLVRYMRTLEVVVERERARHGAWYEFFPRSSSEDPEAHGSLVDAASRLPYVAAMGFDVVYLPPIHPVGREFRKGPNNSVTSEPGDLGSPWAIGSLEGGHTDIHPDLGTIEDLDAFVGAARGLDIEVALDVAFQCAPDHPWVREHPEWFRHRPDGTIQYAENPPKKYQDIVPLDFETESWESLWDALADVVRHWIAHGVSIFRIDNPHTKPFRFWEWLIGTIRAQHPDVIFLSEAFTRPPVMYQLAKSGFSQSYTYFAWRQSAWELRDYFTELTTPPVVDFFRPNAWPNTPDILTEQLQYGGRPVFVQRLVLAATLSANYGIYGPAFELVEQRAAARGSEEYLDSEKYQRRHWDLGAPHSLRTLIARVNQIRREHPALQQNRTLSFHDADGDDLLCYSKTDPQSGDTVLVVVNTHEHEPRSGQVHLDLDALGLGDLPFEVEDLLGGATYTWQGRDNYVELDPATLPAHIFAVRPRP